VTGTGDARCLAGTIRLDDSETNQDIMNRTGTLGGDARGPMRPLASVWGVQIDGDI